MPKGGEYRRKMFCIRSRAAARKRRKRDHFHRITRDSCRWNKMMLKMVCKRKTLSFRVNLVEKIYVIQFVMRYEYQRWRWKERKKKPASNGTIVWYYPWHTALKAMVRNTHASPARAHTGRRRNITAVACLGERVYGNSRSATNSRKKAPNAQWKKCDIDGNEKVVAQAWMMKGVRVM